ncbi:MAG: STAS domain-containing protein [Pyrinomonadaceae bacterium]
MAELIISERANGDAAILDLSGDITFGKSTVTLRNAVRRLIGEDRKKIWLNLEKVVYLDSSGIGELISALTAINREENGELRLLNPTERIQTLFEISNLTKVFDIYRDEHNTSGFLAG